MIAYLVTCSEPGCIRLQQGIHIRIKLRPRIPTPPEDDWATAATEDLHKKFRWDRSSGCRDRLADRQTGTLIAGLRSPAGAEWQNRLVASPLCSHCRRGRHKTVLSCRAGSVNTTGDATIHTVVSSPRRRWYKLLVANIGNWVQTTQNSSKLIFSLQATMLINLNLNLKTVLRAVWIQLETRQNCLVSFASAVWASHYGVGWFHSSTCQIVRIWSVALAFRHKTLGGSNRLGAAGFRTSSYCECTIFVTWGWYICSYKYSQWMLLCWWNV